MTLKELLNSLKSAWCIETAHPSYRDKWNKENPSAGQCAVTALIVQEHFGGKICSCKVGKFSHYINIINDEIVDLTSEQFKNPEYKSIVTKDPKILLKNKDTYSRYSLLKSKIKEPEA